MMSDCLNVLSLDEIEKFSAVSVAPEVSECLLDADNKTTLLLHFFRCFVHCQIVHTHQFNGPFSGTTWVGWYQKGKTNLDFTGARDSEWQ